MEEKILAKVNNREITESDLNRIIERYPVERKIYFETSSGKKQLLDQKIAFTLFGMYAQEMGKDKEESFIKRIDDMKEQMLTQIIMQELFSNVHVTDEQTKEFYDNNEDKFVLEETVKARHILTEDENKIKEALYKINSKELTFEEAAKEYSICPSKDKGGDLGYFKRGMMVKEFEDVAFSIELNTISEPIKSQFGYHIIEVLDKTEKGLLSYEEVKDKILEQLIAGEQQKLYECKLEELKEKYGLIVSSEDAI